MPRKPAAKSSNSANTKRRGSRPPQSGGRSASFANSRYLSAVAVMWSRSALRRHALSYFHATGGDLSTDLALRDAAPTRPAPGHTATAADSAGQRRPVKNGALSGHYLPSVQNCSVLAPQEVQSSIHHRQGGTQASVAESTVALPPVRHGRMTCSTLIKLAFCKTAVAGIGKS